MPLRTVFLLTALPLFVPAVAQAQQYPVDSRNLHERLIFVVPLVGAGTYADPVRPLFVPPPSAGLGQFLSCSWEPTDDGKLAIVEITARDRSAFDAILRDSRVVKKFVKGQAERAVIEKELRAVKKDFRIERKAGGPK